MPRKTMQQRSSLWLKIVGWACLAAGLFGIILPIIPGIPFLVAGVATLSTQHRWVRVIALRLKMRFRRFFREPSRV
jgi:uncharacterized membrane protein YbaN (DUF454 family)